MVVLAIIAVLLSAGIYQMVGTLDTGKEVAAGVTISNLESALLQYQIKAGTYPTTEQGLQALVNRPTVEPVPGRWSACYNAEGLNDPWKRPYRYRFPGEHNRSKPDIYSMGADGVDGTADDIKNW